MRKMAKAAGGRRVRGGTARRRVGAVVAALSLSAGLSAAAAPQNGERIPETFRDADQLLSVLETGDEGIHTLRASVQLDSDFGPLEGGEKQRREGTLYFSTGAKPAGEEGAAQRAFRVDFTRLLLPSGEEGKWVLREEPKSYIFDGRVLLELDAAQKFALVRHVAGPEEEVDPLAIGEGPFPIPIGQKKDEILKRFEAELLGPEAGLDLGEGMKVPPALAGTVQLLLVPRPNAPEAEDFAEVRIWYRRDDADGDGEADFLLPVKARTVNGDKSMSDVNLANVEVNADLKEGLFDTAPPPGWEVEEQDLRRKPGEAE